MSSTTITCLPSIGRDRSWVIRTTPEETDASPYDEMPMKSRMIGAQM
jgi:hypothetical protein